MDSNQAARAVRVQITEEMRGDIGTPQKLRRILGPALLQASQAESAELKQELVTAIARGALEGYLLLDKPLDDASVQVMYAIVEASDSLGFATDFMMRWSLVGVAQAGALAPEGTLDNMRGALSEAFLGLGEAFDEVVAKLKQEPGHRPGLA